VRPGGRAARGWGPWLSRHIWSAMCQTNGMTAGITPVQGMLTAGVLVKTQTEHAKKRDMFEPNVLQKVISCSSGDGSSAAPSNFSSWAAMARIDVAKLRVAPTHKADDQSPPKRTNSNPSRAPLGVCHPCRPGRSPFPPVRHRKGPDDGNALEKGNFSLQACREKEE